MRRTGDRLAATARQFIALQHAIVIGIALIEGVAHPGQIFVQAHPPIAIGIHALQILLAVLDLGLRGNRRHTGTPHDQQGTHDHATRPVYTHHSAPAARVTHHSAHTP